jgi:pimeloyl-ACP methyl ester carboxylesterase
MRMKPPPSRTLWQRRNVHTCSRRRFLLAAGLTTLTACATRSLVTPPVIDGRIDVGGASLPYWDTGGHGAPLILMHPFAGSLESWPVQRVAFAAAGFRVIAYSRRGVGATTRITGPINHAEDLGRVLDALRVRRAHLVTVSGGATVAADFLISHPDRIASAVMACSLISYQDPILLAARRAAAPAPSPTGHSPSPAERQLSEVYRKSNPEGTRRWIEIQRRAQSAGLAPTTQSNEVTLAAIAETHVPILLIAGEYDTLFTPQMLRVVASRLPNAEAHLIRNAAHQAHWEQPEAFNALVLDFLRRQSAS